MPMALLASVVVESREAHMMALSPPRAVVDPSLKKVLMIPD